MKVKIIVLIAALLMTVDAYCHRHGVHGAEQLDTSVVKTLDSRLSGYFKAIEREGADVKKDECDFLIETCTDSLMRQHVALNAYRHYRDSKIMGDEAVAIHVFDKWFLSGKAVMPDDMEMLGAKVFAEFNRRSLIGNAAPEMTLYDMEDKSVNLFDGQPSGRFSILYFYDTSCATCKVQTAMIARILEENDFPVDFYAVYASDNREAWVEYSANTLDITAGSVRTIHLWDPEISSDFQRKYGVIQTPRLFLINPKGVIIGRNLDAAALLQMLQSLFASPDLDYGSKQSMALYDGIFGDDAPLTHEVKKAIDYIAEGTYEEGDHTLFRQMAGDLLYYLANKRGEGYMEGMDYLIDEYILSKGEVWKSPDDSLKIIGMARMFDDLLSRSEPGSQVPDISLPGELIKGSKVKKGSFKLRRLKGENNIIIFYTEGCSHCAAEKSAACELALADRKSRILMVNVDEVLSSSPALAGRLFDSFDLSSLPFIIMTDKKGHIFRRYVSLLQK